mmetsp:Transcript_11464/g.17616  ORF Transcript_11464/g.17616 Transcript_11464/m.17616 type:complete len:175 (-) Transcript_11464:9-533(-)|eukprot:CAMPEP_0178916200 /NCGR_PEP_ID=MMETSP0786-20121207/12484_1 /TAXON_ID=186022 /ORGANISM="Thalassionema frauenfeldii, Strain CCMP 1798" /LENGTH=174 /DNA_ID=CAMNT_0020589463 /DNA_START=1061 /DNA_END=1585 /DNA_ORIENTATION=-
MKGSRHSSNMINTTYTYVEGLQMSGQAKKAVQYSSLNPDSKFVDKSCPFVNKPSSTVESSSDKSKVSTSSSDSSDEKENIFYGIPPQMMMQMPSYNMVQMPPTMAANPVLQYLMYHQQCNTMIPHQQTNFNPQMNEMHKRKKKSKKGKRSKKKSKSKKCQQKIKEIITIDKNLH